MKNMTHKMEKNIAIRWPPKNCSKEMGEIGKLLGVESMLWREESDAESVRGDKERLVVVPGLAFKHLSSSSDETSPEEVSLFRSLRMLSG